MLIGPVCSIKTALLLHYICVNHNVLYVQFIQIILQEKIKTEMKSSNFTSYEKRKRQLYDRYIDYNNQKVYKLIKIVSFGFQL